MREGGREGRRKRKTDERCETYAGGSGREGETAGKQDRERGVGKEGGREGGREGKRVHL